MAAKSLAQVLQVVAAGLETNIEEIRSAVSAIPPSAISTEPDWVKSTRGLAHQACIYRDQAEEIWGIAGRASQSAPNYHHAENRKRWGRYVDEAFDRDNPIHDCHDLRPGPEARMAGRS